MEHDSRFIEQAEYIPQSDFVEWSSEHPDEHTILKKLTQAGAKLLTGPRGCGKTTLMLKAYNSLLHHDKAGAFPIYINFKSSLKLEPLYKTKANGGFWFSQWMYLKVYEGLFQTLENIGTDHEVDTRLSKKDVQQLISYLELGETERVESHAIDLSVYDLENDIMRSVNALGKSRSVLFLDDAAHAFSPEQQRDFFEFFRKIKSRNISPKAAIYPGVTSFAPTFNIGHDAEEVNAWLNPEDEKYFEFMVGMLRNRLPKEVYNRLEQDQALMKIMCYAAFGIPRILLNMMRSVYEEAANHDASEYLVNFSRQNVLKQVKLSRQRTEQVFSSLEKKLPTYKNYITEGFDIYNKSIDLIKNYNKSKKIDRKSISLAIKQNVSPDLKKVFGFFQYAGLASYKGQVSRGEKGTFDLYIFNMAALIDSNALLTTKAFKTEDLAICLEKRNAHEFTRTQSSALLPRNGEPIRLSMPPCRKCGTERSSDEAKFCYNCGGPLKPASIYHELISEDIDVLPLTETRVKGIKKHSSIKTVGDILHDIGHKELRSVPQIGEHWASRIYSLAEEYIS